MTRNRNDQIRIPREKVINLSRQLFSGISFIHLNNITHRNLQPKYIAQKQNKQIITSLFSVILMISNFNLIRKMR
jgi:serine/threonine protein kinase